MKPLSLFIIVLSTTFFSSCEDQPLNPTLPLLRAEKIIYHFEMGFNYQILQYDGFGKVNGLISGVTYPDDGTYENRHEFIYERNILMEIRSHDASIESYKYSYGPNKQVSETSVFLNGKLKESYEFLYDKEGNLIREITWNGSPGGGHLRPGFQRKFKYDHRKNLVEIQQFRDDGEGFKLLTTITYSDYDDKINSEYMFMNNLYHPFIRFCENNPRSVRLVHENGTSAEQKFLYDYNSQGHVTKRRIENDRISIDFEYTEFN